MAPSPPVVGRDVKGPAPNPVGQHHEQHDVEAQQSIRERHPERHRARVAGRKSTLAASYFFPAAEAN